MTELKRYCFSLIIVSVVATVIMLLAPTNSKLIKYLRWITALCVSGVLISPILNLSGKIEFNLPDSDVESVYDYENTTDLILDEFKTKLTESITELVSDKFDVGCKKIDVEIINDDIDAILLEKIYISIDTESSFLKADIKRYLKEKLSCEIDFYD